MQLYYKLFPERCRDNNMPRLQCMEYYLLVICLILINKVQAIVEKMRDVQGHTKKKVQPQHKLQERTQILNSKIGPS